jgi:mannose-6-phosphate isomerase-like protein (cupin superfamily)
MIEQNKTAHRPWGMYEILADEKKYKVKKITVLPDASLSLQLHKKRAEHWVIVKGIANVIKGEDTFILHENESIYIPVETKHRLSNSEKNNLEIIEVQTGDYLEEDDITRFDDIYGRK